ncbi:MAG: hypothetical protein AAGG11_23850 [Pseudomonadota bacterium]
MTKIKLEEMTNCRDLNGAEQAEVRGGLSFGLQQQLNQLQSNLNARGQILFNPYYQYSVIRSSQQAWRSLYGRQMPYFFPMPAW